MPQETRTETRAAAIAAKLIAGESHTWRSAFETARRETGANPPEGAVAREIRRWYALFAPEAHARTLREKRRAALAFMRRARGLDLCLTGVVLSGCATEDSVVELALRAESEKEAAIALLNAGLPADPFDGAYPTAFARAAAKRGALTATLASSSADEPVLIRVVAPHWALPAAARPDEWQHPLEAAGALDAAGLSELLEFAALHPSGMKD
ncbi:hypothetical protein [uncultured Sutterella sp.]|uniref:hypothetical protein n=1 Tax=uncultured Sutterella sp. TaxID=286133 RepID=UPI0025F5D3A8|nr:hypothetical protein [uncultured Sutterella sp.]